MRPVFLILFLILERLVLMERLNTVSWDGLDWKPKPNTCFMCLYCHACCIYSLVNPESTERPVILLFSEIDSSFVPLQACLLEGTRFSTPSNFLLMITDLTQSRTCWVSFFFFFSCEGPYRLCSCACSHSFRLDTSLARERKKKRKRKLHWFHKFEPLELDFLMTWK